MKLSQGQIIHIPNKQELSSMFITHRLNVMLASVSFHIFHMVYELWPTHGLLYGTKSRADNSEIKQARVSSFYTIHRLNVMNAPVKFHKYIPYC